MDHLFSDKVKPCVLPLIARLGTVCYYNDDRGRANLTRLRPDVAMLVHRGVQFERQINI
jgi:hypothetical protein